MTEENKEIEAANTVDNKKQKDVGLKPGLQSRLTYSLHYVNIKNIFNKLKIFLIPFILFYIFLQYDKAANGSEIYYTAAESLQNIKYSIDDLMTDIKTRRQDIRIKTADNNYIVIPSVMQEPVINSKPLSYYRTKDRVLSSYYNKPKKFVNTIMWNYKKILAYNGYHKPLGIKINEDEVLLYENGKQPEIYNHKTKRFELLPSVGYDLGKLYYNNNSGKVLFINKKHITEFNADTKQFTKVSDGIAELKDDIELEYGDYEFLILPYSNEYIYICVFQPQEDFKVIFKSIIKLNIKTFEYTIEEIQNSPQITSYAAVNNNEIVLIVNSGPEYLTTFKQDVIFYNTDDKNFKTMGNVKNTNWKGFYILQYDDNKLLLIPKQPEVSFQTIDLNTMKTEVLNAALDEISYYYYMYSPPVLAGGNIVFSNGIIFNLQKQKLYYPNRLRKIYENFYNRLIVPLNDREFLRLGFTGSGSQFADGTGSIITIKKFNENEFYMMGI